jgi:Zn-finger nucleic acid-binding protein
MKCPVDKSDMIVVEHNNIELDHCLRCSGVWFDCGELELLLETTRSQTGQSCSDLLAREKARVKEKKRRCPICGRAMDKIWMGKITKVLIDSCPIGDGLWFDGGELQQVIMQDKDLNEDVLSFLGDAFQAGRTGKKDVTGSQSKTS